ncbi:MAG: helix-turn-helix transcriptional regulator [Acidobacteriota bacterium]|nr:helix-turn-helix transcriptional regulator [Acidobacteriota bacterium]
MKVFLVMLKLRVREAAKAGGIKNASQLSKVAGISPATAVQLWENEAEVVSLETLDGLCDSLGSKLSDLLVRTQEQEQLKRATARWENEGGAV